MDFKYIRLFTPGWWVLHAIAITGVILLGHFVHLK